MSKIDKAKKKEKEETGLRTNKNNNCVAFRTKMGKINIRNN